MIKNWPMFSRTANARTAPLMCREMLTPAYCFPLIGTSAKIQKEKDCICKTCSIFKEYELNHSFYCTRCSQVCQMSKSEGPAAHGN